ncbi:MAG: glycosyltransferase [Candidatus Margulisiibacteriota bacterium]
MNIAIFTDTYLPQINGVVTSIELFRAALVQKGHKVYIFAPYVGRRPKDERNVFRFRSAKFLFQPEYRISFPFSSKAVSHFPKLDIDIVHSQTPFSMGLLAVYLAKKFNKPLVHTYHTLFSEYVHYLPIPNDYAKNFAIWASKSYCNTNQLVIAPTDQIKDELLRYNVTTPIAVIPTGINLVDVHKIQSQEAEAKYQLDTKSYTYLSTISRLGKEKNIPFLLKTFKRIHDAHPETKLILMGDGPEKKRLEKLAASLGILDALVFTGYIDRKDIFQLLRLSKLFIFASLTETQGLVLLEAMSMKRPVVAIDAMGVSNVLDDGLGGFLCPENELIFSQRVLSLLEESLLYEQKSEEAYRKAMSLSINKMARKLLQCYQSLL